VLPVPLRGGTQIPRCARVQKEPFRSHGRCRRAPV
jgi:hypothetical protein